MRKLKGQFSLGKVIGENGDVTISIREENSGCIAVEARLKLLDFADGLFGLQMRPCEILFNDSGVIGKKHESKTEVIFVPSGIAYGDREKESKKIVKPYEKDGWEAYLDSVTNTHNWRPDAKFPKGKSRDSGMMVEVLFSRYV